MDFIALIIAGIAIGIALKARSRIALLEHNLGLVAKRLEAAPRRQPRRSPKGKARLPARCMGVARAAARDARAAAGGADGQIRHREDHRGSLTSRPPRPQPAKSFEERFGASWVVWIGGLALALGGIFLVQYSIEAGLIGPGVRVFLGGLLAAALVAAGEWTRRARDRRSARRRADTRTSRASSPPPAPPSPTRRSTRPTRSTTSSCPAPPSCCSASWRSRRSPPRCCTARRSPRSAWSARSSRRCSSPRHAELLGALHLSRGRHRRLVRARARAAVALARDHGGRVRRAVDVPRPRTTRSRRNRSERMRSTLVAGFVLVAALLVSGLFYGPDAEPGEIDPVSSVALGAYLFAATLLVLASRHDGVALAAFTLLVGRHRRDRVAHRSRDRRACPSLPRSRSS